ncbi:MAG: protein kinase domain-containing protein, partial [Verrucomicrobiota bacterium]
NIFLCDRGGIPDSVKVLDFGLVREYNADTQDRSAGKEEFVGTPCFMPLEAFENSAASDPRSDIYSLGAVAYYLLTGHFVFEFESIAEIHRKHLNEAITPPSRRSANRISPELETLILRCLNSDPQLRPQSALELRALLLATPHAGDSTPESRADWWSRFGQSESVQNAEPTSLAAIDPARSTPTVKIDLNSRMR